MPDHPTLYTLNSPLPQSLLAASVTPSELNHLATLSTEAKSRAYAPYSKFRVGATLSAVPSSDLKSGPSSAQDPSHMIGANIENASYPVGLCAERSVLSRAVVDGFRNFQVLAISTDITPPASPCGMCRQLYVISVTCLLHVFHIASYGIANLSTFYV